MFLRVLVQSGDRVTHAALGSDAGCVLVSKGRCDGAGMQEWIEANECLQNKGTLTDGV